MSKKSVTNIHTRRRLHIIIETVFKRADPPHSIYTLQFQFGITTISIPQPNLTVLRIPSRIDNAAVLPSSVNPVHSRLRVNMSMDQQKQVVLHLIVIHAPTSLINAHTWLYMEALPR